MRKKLLIGLAAYVVVGTAVAAITQPEECLKLSDLRRAEGWFAALSEDELRKGVPPVECDPFVTLGDRLVWFGLATPLWPGVIAKEIHA